MISEILEKKDYENTEDSLGGVTKTGPFFVVGADRSGTTMLRLMLNEHPELHLPPETFFLIDLIEYLPLEKQLSSDQVEAALQTITHHKRWKDLQIEDQLLVERVAKLDKPFLRDVIDEVYSILLERYGKMRWGDKTPDYLGEMSSLLTVFPRAKFIHIIRDSRDVCMSLFQKKWKGTQMRNAARYWGYFVGRGVEVGRKLPKDQYMEIAYEDVVLNSEEMLRKICLFLDIPFSPLMLDFYKDANKNIASWQIKHHQKTLRAPSIDDVSRWKNELSLFHIFVVEALAGNTMDLVGQDHKFRGISKIFTKIWLLGDEIFVFLLRVRRKLFNYRGGPG